MNKPRSLSLIACAAFAVLLALVGAAPLRAVAIETAPMPDPKEDPEGYEAWQAEQERKQTEQRERAFKVYPIFDFNYQWQRDWSAATSSLHHFDLSAGVHMPFAVDTVGADCYHGIRLQGAGLFDIGSAHGRSARRAGLVARASWEMDTGFPVFFSMPTEHARGLSDDFPFKRGTFGLVGAGFEAGYVETHNTGIAGHETAPRLGLFARGGLFVLELNTCYALELYDATTGHDFAVSLAFPRPALPFGLSFGYRRLSIGPVRSDYFTLGIEVSL